MRCSCESAYASASGYRRKLSNAFSLVEVLVVMAIAAILIGLAIPTTASLMKAYQINSAAQLIVGQLTLARQTALATNHAVQVRFYYLPDYNQANTATPAVFRAMQCFSEGDISPSSTSTTVPLTALTGVNFFPSPVIGSTNANSSSLLASTPTAASSAAGTTDAALPGYGYNYSYVTIRFTAGGKATFAYSSTSNGNTTSNTATFIVEKAKIIDSGNNLPADYLTVSLDSVTGSVQVYRP
jgi:uncharacterized protein (TIGR02596 family)